MESEDVMNTKDTLTRLREIASHTLDVWHFHHGEFPGPEQPDYDDADWKTVDTSYRWFPPDSRAWYRRWVEIPETIGGMDTTGQRIWLEFQIFNDGVVFVDGIETQRFHGSSRRIPLTEPGVRSLVAIQVINHAGHGQLIDARMLSESSTEVMAQTGVYVENVNTIRGLTLTSDQHERRERVVTDSLGAIDFEALAAGNTDDFVRSLENASSRLDVLFEEWRSSARRNLDTVGGLLAELDTLLDRAHGRGIDVSYPLVSRTVAANFVEFADEDLSENSLEQVLRGHSVADTISGSCCRAIEEVRAVLADPSLERPVPRYRTGMVEIRDGAFHQATPLFFTGMGHFTQVRKDIPILNDYGFNIIQITISPANVIPELTSIEQSVIDEIVEVLDRAAEYDVAVNLLIDPGFPKKAFEQNDDLRINHHGFIDYDVDHPVAREVMERYLNALVCRVAEHPALFSIDLMNEPTYYDDGERSHRNFHQWLLERHGNIGGFNAIHGTSHAGFGEIVIPGFNDYGTPRPLWWEWCLFNQERLTRYFEWTRDVIQRLAPSIPTHVKVMGTMFDGQRGFRTGVDHEALAQIGCISGNDNWCHDDLASGEEYAQIWWRQSMYYDFQRSVAPDNPVFNSENHPIVDSGKTWVSSGHMRTMLWQGAIHGQGATTTWVWERHQGGCLADNILTRPNCVEAFGRASLDLLRLAPEIHALQQPGRVAEVAILVAYPSLPLFEEYTDEIKTAYEGLYFLGVPLRFITERQLIAGETGHTRITLAPRSVFVSDDAVRGIESFVRSGGRLVSVGDSFTRDEYGRERNAIPFVDSADVMHADGPLDRTGYRTLLEDLYYREGIARPVRVGDEYQRPVHGVFSRVVADERGHLVYLVNLLPRQQVVKLITGDYTEAIDLVTGSRVGGLIELPSMQPMLIRLS
jgi:hypothetical protein